MCSNSPLNHTHVLVTASYGIKGVFLYELPLLYAACVYSLHPGCDVFVAYEKGVIWIAQADE